MKKSRKKLFYLLFISIVIIIILNMDTIYRDKNIHNYENSPSIPLQKKIMRGDVDQVRKKTKLFCEGYFNFTSNSDSNRELLDDYLHPKFDKNARKEYLKAMQAPNRAKILFVSMHLKELDLFVDDSPIGKEEEFLTSVVKLKIEYTYFVDNKVLKEENKEDYILFWSMDKNEWKVTSIESYNPDTILDY